MEDKDPKDDELNQEGQDDLNDADDSFGLPDLDFDPIDDSEETQEESETEEPEQEESVYASDEEEEVEDETQEEEKEEPVRRYSAYKEESSNKTPLVIIAIVAIILISGGVWYFGFYSPAQKERAEQELVEKQKAEELKRQQEAEAAAQTQEQEVVEEPVAEEPAEVTKGTVTTISEPTQRYYVIIGSFIDGDLAMDLGKELAAKGVSTSLLSPGKSARLYRLSLGDYGSYGEASTAANAMKSEYGENLWVLKY